MMSLSDEYWIDTSYCYTPLNRRNNDCLFDMFGRYSGESAVDVRKDLLDSILEERDFFQQVGCQFFKQHLTNLDDWVADMRDVNSPCDELVLYSLARRYNRHVIVHTTEEHWSTVQHYEKFDENTLLVICHLRLAYVGCGLYGIIRKKGYYATYSKAVQEPPKEIPPHRGRPRKPKQEHTRYRIFDYHESPPTIPVTVDTAKSAVVEIPLDADDIQYMQELANRAASIKTQVVNSVIADLGEQGVTVYDEVSGEVVNNATRMVTTLPDTDHGVADITTSKDLLVTTSTQDVDRVFTTDSNSESSDFIKLHPEAQPVSQPDDDQPVDAPIEDHKDAENTITKVWVEDALRRKCVISLKKLTSDEIYNLRSAPIIDPYSSLEDIISGDESVKSDHQDLFTKQETTEQIIGTVLIKSEYNMRTRPPRHSATSSRPRRSSRQDINYSNFHGDATDSDDVKPKKPTKKQFDCKSEPSEERMAAQRFYRKDTSLSKPHRRYPFVHAPTNKPDPYDVSTDEYDIPDPPGTRSRSHTKKERSPSPSPPTKKVKLIIKTRGRRKPSSNRTYKCPNCPATRSCRSNLNDHYKLCHPPVTCQQCGKVFVTPSSLERHSYYHVLPLQFPCLHQGCQRLFPFTSDWDRHALVHRTARDWVCMYPRCKKRFLAKGELTKHAKVHGKTYYECDVCTYKHKDIRNVKAHEWSHREGPGKFRYFCDNCPMGFTYYTQWKRHMDKKPAKCLVDPEAN